MPYPPRIDDATLFPAAPAAVIVAACQLAQETCSIATLTLQGHPSANTSFDAPAGAPLAPAAAGRYVMAPVVEAFPIAWTLTGHDRIRGLRLELYRRGDPAPFWWKNLDYGAAGSAAAGSTPFDGDLHNNVHLASIPPSTVNVGAALAGNFPLEVLTAEHAPYKLLLRIQEVQPPTRVTCAARWIYLDVMIHDIELHLEDVTWIPPAGPTYPDLRYRQLTAQTRTALAAQLAAGDLGVAAPVAANVPLAMNVFSRSAEDFYSNSVFAGQKLLFRDGPTLPLRATVRIRRSDGTPAAAQAGASALGGLALQWDWESGVRPAHPNPTAQAFIAEALDYKPTEWPGARANCHVDHGGKRGVNAHGVQPHFLALPATALVAPADAIANVANRPWAVSSRPIADSADQNGGKAGVLFLPSRIAGDTYRLRVYLGYPALGAFDVAADGALQAAADNSVSVRSATTLTVRHRVDVAHQWRKNVNVNDAGLNWVQVRAYLAAACVDLEGPAMTENIAALSYQNAAATHFATLDTAQQLAVDLPANQHNGNYAITFVNYAAFCTAVRTRGNALHAQFAAAVFPTDGAFRGAQMAALGLNALNRPTGYHVTDLILPTRADLARSPNQRRDILLGELGITNEETYKNKCKSWGAEIIAALCGLHARTSSPDEFGIHLYHFDFADQWFQQNMAAEAATTISNFPLCPDCGAATDTVVPAQGNRNCNCGLRLDQSALVTCYAPFIYMNGVIDGWALANLTRKERVKIRAGRLFGTSAALSIAHEIGHHLGMPHAGPHAHLGPIPVMTTGGIYPPFHDAADNACIMSYNFTEAPQLHFCGLCSLRLAGWSMGMSNVATQPTDFVQDQSTSPLSNRAAFNPARAPAPGAVWQTPDPAQCPTCQRALGGLRPAHHCRLCGNVFCGDHSSHTRPVRNPLKADPVSVERVCNNCDAPPYPLAPDPSARWEPDDKAWDCAHPGCGVVFSTTNRKHHCRACGKIYCNTHSHGRAQVRNALSADGPTSQQRVCDACNALYG
ncbi:MULTISPECIES: FYVE zinc finger domain-containing protein [unclassified Pseudomonas]|uniref:FYVE zinc finger domain-containing protein n=1 Tax=unclassified Pseudomonas TaxID=196821 RepID=UPI00128B0CA8|nr:MULTISPECIES: FYVE zinc finger domain-containing protein [unclassified Pseudomonas]MPQ68084.1 hypothetical protein [Pseudomonas sp. MWU12-2323]